MKKLAPVDIQLALSITVPHDIPNLFVQTTGEKSMTADLTRYVNLRCGVDNEGNTVIGTYDEDGLHENQAGFFQGKPALQRRKHGWTEPAKNGQSTEWPPV